MSFTAILNGAGNFNAAIKGVGTFNVSPQTQAVFNVGMAAIGPKGEKGDTGIVSVDLPLIYDSILRNLSIDLSDYATLAYSNSTFQTISGMSNYYPVTNPAGYITLSALNGYATELWVESQNYLTSVDLSGYATESWVTSQGYETASHAASTYYPLTNPNGYITSSALSPYLLSSTAASTYQLIGDYATNTALTNGLAGKANTVHTHDASAIVSGTIDLARIPIIPSQIQVVSTQDSIANLTVGEQAQITGAGVLVTTTDGNRWVYSGSGSKTSESSYVKVADITPDWSVITNKPAFGSMSLEATGDWLSKAGNLYGLASPSTARTNLGLGSIATESASSYYLASNPSGYIDATALTGYATETFVTSQGYLTAPYNPFDQSLNTTDSPQFQTVYSNVVRPYNLNGNLNLVVYNDTGAGTTFTNYFDAYTGGLVLASNGGGITFGDATVQTTAWTGSYNPFNQTLNTTDIVQFDKVYVSTINVAVGSIVIDSVGIEIASGDISFLSGAGGITFADGTTQNTAYTGPQDLSGYALKASTNTFTASQIIEVTDNTNAALRITQLGTGDALRVEDSANPDASPFIVDQFGSVLIGKTTGTAGVKLDVVGSATFQNNNTVAIGVGSNQVTLAVTNIGTNSVATFVNTATATSDAVRITNLGTGNSFVVEDSTNPDANPFVINNGGQVGIGVLLPSSHVDIASGISSRKNLISSHPSSVYTANNVEFNESGSGVNLSVTSSATATGDAVRITNLGTGNSFVVEDSTNPDSTPFAIDASGNVGIGLAPSTSYKLSISGNLLVAVGSPASTYSAIVSTNATGVNISNGATNTTAALTVTNIGTGNSFVVNDQASDTTPFIVGAGGNVGIKVASPAYDLDVAGGTVNLSTIRFADATTQTTAYTGPQDLSGYLTIISAAGTYYPLTNPAGYVSAGYNPFDQSLNTNDSVNFASISYSTQTAPSNKYSVTPNEIWAGYYDGVDLVRTTISSTGVTFPDNTIQTTAYLGGSGITPPIDTNINWLATWNVSQQTFTTTEGTQEGQLLSDQGGSYQIKYSSSGSFNGTPEIVVTQTGGTAGATIISATGIQFPDMTYQTTASTPADAGLIAGFFGASPTGGPYSTTAAPTTGQILSYDGTNLIWTSDGGGAYLPLSDGGTITATASGATTAIDGFSVISTYSGYSSQSTFSPIQIGIVNTSLSEGTEINQNGITLLGSSQSITFPDSTVQTTAYTGPQDLSAYLLSATAASTYFPIPTGLASDYLNGLGVPVTFPSFSAAARIEQLVYNETGADIQKGSVVYINGSHGNDPTVALAQANSELTSSHTIGLAESIIPNMGTGLIVTTGILEGMETHLIATGTDLYLSSTVLGGYTTEKQWAPNHYVKVGTVIRSHPTFGSIYVSIDNGFQLDELSDVQHADLANNDVMVYDFASGLWKNKTYPAAGILSASVTALPFINDGLTNADAPSSTNPFATEGFVDSAVSSYAAYVDPLLPTANQKEALTAAVLPSVSNPLVTASEVSSYVPTATESISGKVQLATIAEVQNGFNDLKAVTPSDVTWGMAAYGAKQSITSYTAVVSGTGAVTASAGEWGMSVTAPNIGLTGHAFRVTSSGTISSINRGVGQAQIRWDKPILITGGFNITSTLDPLVFCRTTIGKPPTGSTIGALISRGFGWRFNGGGLLYLEVHNGTTLTTVSTGITIPAASGMCKDFALYSDGLGNVTLYIDDVAVATSASGPTGSGNFYNNSITHEIQSTGATAVGNGRVSFGGISAFFGR